MLGAGATNHQNELVSKVDCQTGTLSIPILILTSKFPNWAHSFVDFQSSVTREDWIQLHPTGKKRSLHVLVDILPWTGNFPAVFVQIWGCPLTHGQISGAVFHWCSESLGLGEITSLPNLLLHHLFYKAILVDHLRKQKTITTVGLWLTLCYLVFLYNNTHVGWWLTPQAHWDEILRRLS